MGGERNLPFTFVLGSFSLSRLQINEMDTTGKSANLEKEGGDC